MPKTLKEISKFINGELVGDGEITITGINGIQEAKEGDLAFIAHPKDEDLINSAKASCIIIPKSINRAFNKPTIKVEYPSMALSKIIEFVLPDSIPHPKGIHKTAIISESAAIGKNVSIGPYAVIADKVEIGDNTVIYSFSCVGKNSKIGGNCIIYPNVIIREKVIIGNRVIIHPGYIIGSDGFGYDTL